MTYDPADLATRVRALAVRAHQILRANHQSPPELRELSEEVVALKTWLDQSPHADLARWLNALGAKVDMQVAASAARAARPQPAKRGQGHLIMVPDPVQA